MQISFEPMSPVNQEDGRYDGAAVVLQALTDAYAIPQAHVVTRGDNRLYVSGIVDLPGHRHLADVDVIVRISDLDPSEAITLRLKIFKPDGPSVVVDILAVADADGSARVQMVIDMDYLNEDFTDVCNSCALEEEIIECPRTSDCDEITDNVSSKVCGHRSMIYLVPLVGRARVLRIIPWMAAPRLTDDEKYTFTSQLGLKPNADASVPPDI